MLGLRWTQRITQSGLAFLSLCLFIFLLSFTLQFGISCLCLFPSQVSWLIPIHFSSPTFEIAFPETEILGCYWQQMLFLPRIGGGVCPPFVSFPLFFLSARVFFVLCASFPVWYPILSLFFFQDCSPLPFSLICKSLLLLLTSWGISNTFFFCISPSLPALLSSLPSASRYLMQLYRHLTAALPANPGRSWPAQTPTDVERSCMCPAANNNSQAIRGCLFPPSLPSHVCLEQKSL